MQFQNAKLTQSPLAGAVAQVETEEAQAEAQAVDTNLTNAIAWLGKQFRTIREWTGSDNRTYASISHSGVDPMNGVHHSPLDVADEILGALATKQKQSGEATFATFPMKYNGKTVEARLIKSDRVNDKLLFALNVEYNISASTGTLQSFAKKAVVAPEAKIDFGFGKIPASA